MRRCALAFVTGAALLVGCGGEGATRRSRVLHETAASPRAYAYPSPATFRYHPKEAAPVLATLALPDGSVVYAGERGERWLVEPGSKVSRAASELAPEDLVAVLRGPSGAWTFVGKSGSTYEAAGAISPFTASAAPAEPLALVRVAGSVLVGIQRDGTLARSEVGSRSFSRVGPDARFADVALRMDGTGLALAVPERLHRTEDFGKSWSALAPSSLGIEALSGAPDGPITLVTALGTRRFDPSAQDPFPVVPAGAARAPRGITAPLGPSASAIIGGRFALLSSGWVELREIGGPRLVRGELGGGFEESPLAIAKGCAHTRLAGSGGVLYFLCARQPTAPATQPLEIRRSIDAGRTWTVEPYAAFGRVSELALSVGADGELVLSGVCPARATGPGCRPAGIHHRAPSPADSGPGTVLEPGTTPSLSGSALFVLHSLDGRTVIALGRRTKGSALAVFVSTDGARTFDVHDIDGLAANDEDDRARGRPGELVIEAGAASEDGTVGFVVRRKGQKVWLVLDQEGQAIALAKPPVEAAEIGVAGSRAFAVNPRTREAYESLDAGATFKSLGKLLLDPCPAGRDCSPYVACVSRGCVLSDVASRVGWGAAPPRPPRAASLAEVEGRKESLAVPFSCTLDAGEWTRPPGALGPPITDQAAIGKAAWFAVRPDPGDASVSLLVQRGGKLAPEERVLLPARAVSLPDVLSYSVQVEGVAALRYSIPGATGKGPPELSRIEVAWSDLIAGREARGVIASGGHLEPGDFEGEPGRGKAPATRGREPDGDSFRVRANPALLSIASGGVYVRLHRSLGDNQPTYFLDGKGVETIPAVSWPDAVRKRGRSEMVHVGRAHVPLRIDGSTVVRARRQGAAWTFDAFAAGYRQPSAFGLVQHVDMAYASGSAGLQVLSSDLAGRRSSAFLAPFRAEGPLFDAFLPVPTQLGLADNPRACDARERVSSPRVVVPRHGGKRHPIIVADLVEPLRVLLTSDAVLHGSPGEPCVAAFGATLVATESTGPVAPETALVLMDSLERAWLFRPAAGTKGAPSGFEYRTMRCRADPGAEVPLLSSGAQ